MAAYKDYYAVLGVPKTATQKEVRAAFRKLAAKHHPDKNPGDAAAEERFKEINEAYTVLSDEEKRRFYDQFGSEGGRPPFRPGAAGGQVYTNVNPEEFAGFSDFFQTLFGGGFEGFGTRGGDPFAEFQQADARRQPLRQNLEATLELDLLTAYRGGSTTISLDGRRIEVDIPKGTRDGSRLRLRGQAPGGGDLLLRIRHQPHPIFELDGDNVRVTVDVPDYAAVLGGAVRVPTLSGEVEMTLPSGTQSGRVLRLRGRGWPRKDGSYGDELAEVRVRIPSAPSPEQLEHYRQLRELAETKKVASASD